MRVVTASTNTVTRPQRAAAVPARQLRRCTTQHQLLATATRLDESQPWSFAVAEDSTFRENASKHSSSLPSRRSALVAAAAVAVTLTKPRPSAAAADAATRSGRDGADFVVSPSGLEYLDVRAGEGATPAAGDRVTVHWAGYTK
jgi:FKBP-type peptidyl-prolyl cis-trans isomerase